MKIDVLVTGANRGIGLEFVRQYLDAGARVVAGCRNPRAATQLKHLQQLSGSRLEIVELDVADPGSVARLATDLTARPVEILINNAGVYGPKGVRLENLDAGTWLDVFRINSLAPVQVTAALLDNLQAAEQPKVVAISSRMGSIGDNTSGGAYIYRSSKAALNAAIASLAIDLRDRGVMVSILHPGWVETDMGGPNALIDAQTSVKGMRRVIAAMKLSATGSFLSYDGSKIPW